MHKSMTNGNLKYQTRITEARNLAKDWPKNRQVYAFFNQDRIELFNEEQVAAELRKYSKIGPNERRYFACRVFALRSQRELRQSA
jgi:hypothetical protein